MQLPGMVSSRFAVNGLLGLLESAILPAPTSTLLAVIEPSATAGAAVTLAVGGRSGLRGPVATSSRAQVPTTASDSSLSSRVRVKRPVAELGRTLFSTSRRTGGGPPDEPPVTQGTVSRPEGSQVSCHLQLAGTVGRHAIAAPITCPRRA